MTDTARDHPVPQSMSTIAAVREFGAFDYAAGSWPQAYRAIVRAEVLAGSDTTPAKANPR